MQPKFDAELAEFRQLKVKETGDPNAQINVWDWRYFSNQLKKEKYNVDAEQLRVYFPYQRVLDGMFAIYQRIFGLKFERGRAALQMDRRPAALRRVRRARPASRSGLFYLDMFPREGKYNHFAQFGLIEGKLLPDGKYQRPTVALICNFPAPTKDKPSLLSHSDVETLFHEFGHAMHSILTRAKYARFSGTSVPRDFVEAPSQMLENWVWDKKVLDSFAADYRDPSKKIPAEILAKLKEARLATEGTRYRRQLSFGLMDLTLHTQIHDGNADGGAAAVQQGPERGVSADGAGHGVRGLLRPHDRLRRRLLRLRLGGRHCGGHGDGVREVAGRLLRPGRPGMRLREEIYEPGDSRDVNVSIEKFLGRPRSLEPFLKKIGVKHDAPTTTTD